MRDIQSKRELQNWLDEPRPELVAADALLMEANERFRSMHPRAGAEDMMDDFEIAHATVLLDCIVQGLEAARASGVFGWSEPFLAVWISDSGSEVMLESVQRLNSPAVWTEFLTEFGS